MEQDLKVLFRQFTSLILPVYNTLTQLVFAYLKVGSSDFPVGENHGNLYLNPLKPAEKKTVHACPWTVAKLKGKRVGLFHGRQGFPCLTVP